MKKEVKSDYLVVQDNSFAKGVFKQTLLGQKIILATISCIEEKDEDFKKYEFNITDLSKSLNSKNQNIIKVVDALAETSIKIWSDNKDRYRVYPIFACIDYDRKSKLVIIQINNLVMPFLLRLKENFTGYYLSNIANLKSIYALRLYNILKADAYRRVVEYELEAFKIMIDCSYDKTSNLKQKVLEVAKKEINIKTDLIINYEMIKTGRKVTSIRFYIEVSKNKEQELYDKGETFTF